MADLVSKMDCAAEDFVTGHELVMEGLDGMEVSSNGGILLRDQGRRFADWRGAFSVGRSHGQVSWLVGVGLSIGGDMHGSFHAGCRLETGSGEVLNGAGAHLWFHVLFPRGRVFRASRGRLLKR